MSPLPAGAVLLASPCSQKNSRLGVLDVEFYKVTISYRADDLRGRGCTGAAGLGKEVEASEGTLQWRAFPL